MREQWHFIHFKCSLWEVFANWSCGDSRRRRGRAPSPAHLSGLYVAGSCLPAAWGRGCVLHYQLPEELYGSQGWERWELGALQGLEHGGWLGVSRWAWGAWGHGTAPWGKLRASTGGSSSEWKRLEGNLETGYLGVRGNWRQMLLFIHYFIYLIIFILWWNAVCLGMFSKTHLMPSFLFIFYFFPNRNNPEYLRFGKILIIIMSCNAFLISSQC